MEIDAPKEPCAFSLEDTFLQFLDKQIRNVSADFCDEILEATLLSDGALYEFCKTEQNGAVWRKLDILVIRIISCLKNLPLPQQTAIANKICSFVATALTTNMMAQYEEIETDAALTAQAHRAAVHLIDGYLWLTGLIKHLEFIPSELDVARLSPGRNYNPNDERYASVSQQALHMFCALLQQMRKFNDHVLQILTLSSALFSMPETKDLACALRFLITGDDLPLENKRLEEEPVASP